MRKEIELEAPPQQGVLDLADSALPGGSRIRDQDVDAAEMCSDAVECPACRRGIGDIAFDGEHRAADLVRRRLRAIDIEQRHLGAGPAHRKRSRKPNGSGTAGDDGDLAGEWLLATLAELRLLQ